jgi:hypothetical protein
MYGYSATLNRGIACIHPLREKGTQKGKPTWFKLVFWFEQIVYPHLAATGHAWHPKVERQGCE